VACNQKSALCWGQKGERGFDAIIYANNLTTKLCPHRLFCKMNPARTGR